MNYDKETVEARLKLFNEIHRAKLDGKMIERISETDGLYHPYKEMVENLTLSCIHKFRVQPEAKYRRFLHEWEFIPYKNKWITNKKTRNFMQVVAFSSFGIDVVVDEHIKGFLFEHAFKLFVFEDGTPFGIQE